jgi:hypothetical protein
MMIVVVAVAVTFAMIKWIVTNVIQPKEDTYHGNTFISSRRLTSKDLERLNYRDSSPNTTTRVEATSRFGLER